MDDGSNSSRKNFPAAADAGDSDPFVRLPENCLMLIASFLSNDDAARLAAVSKPWAAICFSSPSLVLDERHFTDDEQRRLLILDGRQDLADGIKRNGRSAFLRFARRFAAIRKEKPDLHCFVLRFSSPEDFPADVQQWVRLATARAPKEVQLDFSDGDSHSKFPQGFIGHAALMPEVYSLGDELHALKLSGCSFNASKFSTFSTLRVLSIARIQLTPQSITILLENCRRLEDLSLRKLIELEEIIIQDRNGLRRLTIENCEPLTYGVTVDAPMVEHFKYSGFVRAFSLEVWKVEEAELDFGSETEFGGEGDLLSDVLLRLGNAKRLVVCGYLTQVIASGEEQFHLPTTNDMLRHLVLKTALHKNELPGIALLLRSYPQLESVTVEMTDHKTFEDFEYPYTPVLDEYTFWESQILGIRCLRSHLKTIRVEGFKGTENEIQFLRYLLGRSRALENVIINISKEMSAARKEFFTTALSGFSKASPVVQIVIS